MFGPYAAFIIPAYLVSAVVIAVMTGWIIHRHGVVREEIAQLEQQGIKRRSTQTPTSA